MKVECTEGLRDQLVEQLTETIGEQVLDDPKVIRWELDIVKTEDPADGLLEELRDLVRSEGTDS